MGLRCRHDVFSIGEELSEADDTASVDGPARWEKDREAGAPDGAGVHDPRWSTRAPAAVAVLLAAAGLAIALVTSDGEGQRAKPQKPRKNDRSPQSTAPSLSAPLSRRRRLDPADVSRGGRPSDSPRLPKHVLPAPPAAAVPVRGPAVAPPTQAPPPALPAAARPRQDFDFGP